MSATLYFSNSPALLLERLSANLEWDDPFQSPAIATPSAAMKRWVQLRLADERGIVANVQFLHLERTLWKRLEDLDQHHVTEDRKPARLLDEQGLQLLILGLLRRNPPAEAREYLRETSVGPGKDRDRLHARRLIQLSLKLAGYFREYEYSRVEEHGRKGLAHLWKHGQDCFLPFLDAKAPKWRRQEVERLERWQKAIYHELFRGDGLRDILGRETKQYSYTLPQYAEMVLTQPRRAGLQGKPPGYHLFGLSQISPFHRSLIRRLADAERLPGWEADFHIYSLNPCAEYWEDALHPREHRARQQEDLFRRQKYQDWRKLEEAEKRNLRLEEEMLLREELDLDEENALLALWGKPGREAIQLWLQVTDYDFLGSFREARGGTLLAAVRNAVLGRRGSLPPEERARQDDSLQILACPEIHREVETVHQGIVDALLHDPALRPDEIAVLVPDMDKYREVFSAVFGLSAEGEAGHVPYNLSGSSASAESDYAKAVAALFDLAGGRFSRREVFALASNPCFGSGQGLDESMLKVWGKWAGRLNIFHGFDAEDRRQRGYSPEPAHTWSHGLERLVLGTVMETPPPGDPRHYDGVVPYADGDTSDADTLQPFLVLVEGLHRDLASLRDGRRRPWSEWLDILDSLLDRYLAPPADQPLEAYVQAEVRRCLLELRGMDRLEGLARPAPEGRVERVEQVDQDGVPADLPMGLVLERLRGLKAGREPQLSGGVNVSALAAMKSLPFKLIYVLGLGEGEFPEDDAASTLDLRGYRRVIGDVDPSARNRYLFLETLACASGRLRLSWVSRDVRQGKALQMSSVLTGLRQYVEDCILVPDDGKRASFRITEVPLLSRSPSLFAEGPREPWDPPPNLSREERLLAWLERKKSEFRSLAGNAGDPAAWPEFARRGLPERAARALFPSPAAAGEEPATETPDAPTPLPLEDIRLYLENPAGYTLRRRLGISDWREEDPRELEEEPFFTSWRQEADLLDGIFLDRMGGWEETGREGVKRNFLERYANLGLRGNMPAGHYREVDRDALWDRAGKALDSLDAFLEPWRRTRAGLRVYRGAAFGDSQPRSGEEPELKLPPVRLLAAGRTLDLHGHIPCLMHPEDRAGGATLVYMTGKYERRRLLPAYLFYLAGLLSDTEVGERLRGGPFKIFYIFTDGKGASKVENWAPFQIDPEEARAYLVRLAEGMLGPPDFDLLPFEMISRLFAHNGALEEGRDFAGDLRDELDRTEDADDFNPAYKPSDSLIILDPKVPDDAGDKIKARLASFFNFRAEP